MVDKHTYGLWYFLNKELMLADVHTHWNWFIAWYADKNDGVNTALQPQKTRLSNQRSKFPFDLTITADGGYFPYRNLYGTLAFDQLLNTVHEILESRNLLAPLLKFKQVHEEHKLSKSLTFAQLTEVCNKEQIYLTAFESVYIRGFRAVFSVMSVVLVGFVHWLQNDPSILAILGLPFLQIVLEFCDPRAQSFNGKLVMYSIAIALAIIGLWFVLLHSFESDDTPEITFPRLTVSGTSADKKTKVRNPFACGNITTSKIHATRQFVTCVTGPSNMVNDLDSNYIQNSPIPEFNSSELSLPNVTIIAILRNVTNNQTVTSLTEIPNATELIHVARTYGPKYASKLYKLGVASAMFVLSSLGNNYTWFQSLEKCAKHGPKLFSIVQKGSTIGFETHSAEEEWVAPFIPSDPNEKMNGYHINPNAAEAAQQYFDLMRMQQTIPRIVLPHAAITGQALDVDPMVVEFVRSSTAFTQLKPKTQDFFIQYIFLPTTGLSACLSSISRRDWHQLLGIVFVGYALHYQLHDDLAIVIDGLLAQVVRDIPLDGYHIYVLYARWIMDALFVGGGGAIVGNVFAYLQRIIF